MSCMSFSGTARFFCTGVGTDHVAKNRQVLEELLLKEITDFTLEERKGCLVFVDGEFWGLYLVGRVNTAETFAEEPAVPRKKVQVIENRYPSQIAPEYGELYRLVTEGEYFRTRNVSLTTPCALWETGWLPWRRSPRA